MPKLLETELEFYREHCEAMSREHPGRFVVVSARDLIAVCDTVEEAYGAAADKVPGLVVLITRLPGVGDPGRWRGAAPGAGAPAPRAARTNQPGDRRHQEEVHQRRHQGEVHQAAMARLEDAREALREMVEQARMDGGAVRPARVDRGGPALPVLPSLPFRGSR